MNQGYIPKYILTNNMLFEIPLGFLAGAFCLSQTKNSYSVGGALLITTIIGAMLSTTRKESPQEREQFLISYRETRKRIPTCDWDPDDGDNIEEQARNDSRVSATY
jgi:hypothetical protein